MSNDKICCFLCDKKVNFLYECSCEAVMFTSTGNFGSCVYDLAPEIVLYLCDSCFVTSSHKFNKIYKKVTYTTTPFDYNDYCNGN